MLEIRKDFELARECHAEMYEFADESQISAMDNWEDMAKIFTISKKMLKTF